MMSMKFSRLFQGLLIVALASLSGSALAEPEFVDTFIAHYKLAADSPLAAQSCALCHVSDSDFAFNPYGKDIKAELAASGAKSVTDAVLVKVDALDSNGDGVLNGAEIAAGNAPGAPSKKAGTPPPAPEKSEFPPKNGFHPAIVHFPIALFLAALLLDFIGLVKRNQNFLLAGWYNMILAAASSLAGVASGILAMSLSGFPFKGTMREHIIYAGAATIAMWIMVAMRVHRHEKMNLIARLIYYALAVIGMLTISWAGHVGGVLVYGE